MSWIRSAVSKAVEVGNRKDLARVVKNYADSVVHHAGQAVAEGAKILQDRIGARNYRSVNHTITRLEEAAVSCRGPERAQLMKGWLMVLKEIERTTGDSSEEKGRTIEQHLSSDEERENPKSPSLVLYYDPDIGGEPMNFHEVFLRSQALEGIILSMIVEAPSDEEVSIVLEMFGHCLLGGKEAHNAVLSSIQDLAKVFSSYEEEVLVKRDELLQFAESAIAGLKINAYLGRVDAEVNTLKKRLDEMKASQKPQSEGHVKSSEGTTVETIEELKEARAHIRICSQLEDLLLQKKSLSTGESSESYSQKVAKLKILAESLSSSTAKAEKRISDQRLQKEEALKVRVAKVSDASEKEKDLSKEIAELEKQRDDIEAQLKKVNISLAATHARLRDTREERDQFEEASNQIVVHLKEKEDELLKSIASCRTEGDVLKIWITFLEDTWNIRCLYAENKENVVSEELERHEDYFLKLVIYLLSSYKKELGPSINRIRQFTENLKKLSEGLDESSSFENDESKALNPRKTLEEEYLDHEAKIITTFSVVDSMKEQYFAQSKISRNDSQVQDLLEDIDKLKVEFDCIERPYLEMETPTPKSETPTKKLHNAVQPPVVDATSPKSLTDVNREPPAVDPDHVTNSEVEIEQSKLNVGKDEQDYATEEIGDWDFDELEKELISSDSTSSKKITTRDFNEEARITVNLE